MFFLYKNMLTSKIGRIWAEKPCVCDIRYFTVMVLNEDRPGCDVSAMKLNPRIFYSDNFVLDFTVLIHVSKTTVTIYETFVHDRRTPYGNKWTGTRQ